MIINVLTVAGSDPSGGAGIQADLKTFSALGVFGTSVITALTAQNTRGVTGVHAVPAAFIAAQLDALFDDVEIAAVKIGMVATPDVARVIAEALRRHRCGPVIVDPVMVAKGGDRLVDDRAVAAVREHLLPLATLITPNVHEAGTLLGEAAPVDVDGMARAARALLSLGPGGVLVKGGALGGASSTDILCDGDTVHALAAPRVDTRNVHGTGCTLSSAIAALLPRRPGLERAVRDAKDYVGAAIAASAQLRVGSGHGPVHHFHRYW